MPDDARAQILAAAMSVMADKGFAGTSMNDIVRASGLSKGGVYWHFASKDDIVTAVFDLFFEAQVAALKVIVDEPDVSATDKLMRVVGIGGADLEALAAQFPSSLEFYALAARDETLRNHLTHYFVLYQTLMQQLVVQATTSGEWKAVDPAATADTVITLVEGALLLYGALPGKIHLDTQLQASITLLLEGLKQPPGD